VDGVVTGSPGRGRWRGVRHAVAVGAFRHGDVQAVLDDGLPQTRCPTWIWCHESDVSTKVPTFRDAIPALGQEQITSNGLPRIPTGTNESSRQDESLSGRLTTA